MNITTLSRMWYHALYPIEEFSVNTFEIGSHADDAVASALDEEITRSCIFRSGWQIYRYGTHSQEIDGMTAVFSPQLVANRYGDIAAAVHYTAYSKRGLHNPELLIDEADSLAQRVATEIMMRADASVPATFCPLQNHLLSSIYTPDERMWRLADAYQHDNTLPPEEAMEWEETQQLLRETINLLLPDIGENVHPKTEDAFFDSLFPHATLFFGTEGSEGMYPEIILGVGSGPFPEEHARYAIEDSMAL